MNYGLLFAQLLNVFLLIMWIGLAIIALNQMRHRVLSGIVYPLWIAMIVFVPILGAMTFLLTKPGTPRDAEKTVTPSSCDV
ncbi:MAG: hypothetical protein GFH27_549309n92 [Chloroflexi bacterium AL-W]|nr:hypothetical protein [Chloroflexi bacterium AL-N1]NOK69794.1 hypothetical protein [Chloroflexi bacterium AL-N10]NOK73602.1 hypothetical protein [Chloroflexi bacterium AL-N5]NOK83964.1 hypothetical protein [Chloroflexi bacterium AL-W]NOK87933.1 hypothetical protein [Chloroflexi bacterium AL-N15]